MTALPTGLVNIAALLDEEDPVPRGNTTSPGALLDAIGTLLDDVGRPTSPIGEVPDAPRPEVVALLADVDMDRSTHPREWTHRDGRALTRDDLTLIGSATDAELAAFAVEVAAARTAEDDVLDLVEELLALVEPVLATLPEGALLADVVPLLNPEQLATYDRLVKALTPGDTAPPSRCSSAGACGAPAPGPVPVEIGAAP